MNTMDKNAYLEMKYNQDNHWWYKARKLILEQIVSRVVPSQSQRILEIGCGTGGNIEFLSQYGYLTAIDNEEIAITSCKDNPFFNSSRVNFIHTKVECISTNFPEKSFDLICMFDVLEHIENDREILIQLRKLLSDTGKIIISVPAYDWLWSPHDEYLHHKRRYTRPRLTSLSIDCGYKVLKSGYFNTFLLPAAIMERMFSKFRPIQTKNVVQIPSPMVNNFLFQIFKLERFLVNRLTLPFGLSVWAVLEN